MDTFSDPHNIVIKQASTVAKYEFIFCFKDYENKSLSDYHYKQ